MKKFIIVLVFILYSGFLFSQGNPVNYTEVINIDSTISKAELFNRAKLWFSSAYKSSSDVLQVVDSENGQLIGKALLKFTPSSLNSSDRVKGYIKYTIKIFIKEGRYKYEITDLTHQPTGNSSYGNIEFGLLTTDEDCPYTISGQFKKWVNSTWVEMKSQSDEAIKPLISNLKEAMLKQTEIENSDW